MLNVNRHDMFQVYQDYLDYMYPPVTFENIAISVSVIMVRSFTNTTHESLLDTWLYKEEVGGRVMVSQDGLTIGVTEAGKKVYEKLSFYYRREFGNV